MPGLDTGNTAFMLLCSSLVMLMTPGLAFFYGGLVSRKNVLAIMIQSFVSLCWTTVLWYTVGYSLCFSGGQGGVIGNLDMAFLRGVTLTTPSPNDTIPALVFVAYQMMFAIITPALITGAFTNRVTFKAYLAFLPAEEQEAVLPRRLDRYTGTTVTDRRRLAQELEAVRRDGYAVCVGELEESLFGASAPVLSEQGRPVAIVSVWGTEHRLPRERLPEVGRRTVEAAQELKELLR